MANRFDNLSLEDLFEREREARAEVDAVADALKSRLLAECPLHIGMVYRFTWKTRWAGTEFLVCSLRPDSYWFPRRTFFLGVHGFRATKKSTVGDGFGRRPAVLRDWRLLDLCSERPGPRPT